MNKYRRIEIKAFSRRVTIVSGEWPRAFSSAKPLQIEDDRSLDGANLCAPVEADTPEGQLILVEAMRSLERRLSPESRATIRAGQNTLASNHGKRTGLYRKLRSFYESVRRKAIRFEPRIK